jgi:hypothetical protein
MKFSDLTECPFCGGSEYYTKEYVYGVIRYNEYFDGTEAENELMYDGLNYKSRAYNGKAYCRSCDKYLGSVADNTVSVAAQKALKRNGGEQE